MVTPSPPHLIGLWFFCCCCQDFVFIYVYVCEYMYMLVNARGDQKRVSHPNFGDARIQTQEQQVLFATKPSLQPQRVMI